MENAEISQYVKESTEASHLPLRVADDEILHKVGAMVAAVTA